MLYIHGITGWYCRVERRRVGHPYDFKEGQLRPREDNALHWVTQLVNYPTRARTQVAWLRFVLCAQAYIPLNDFANYNHMMMPPACVLTPLWCSSVITGIYRIMFIDNVSRSAAISDNIGVVFKLFLTVTCLQKVGLLNDPQGKTAKWESSLRILTHLSLIR